MEDRLAHDDGQKECQFCVIGRDSIIVAVVQLILLVICQCNHFDAASKNTR